LKKGRKRVQQRWAWYLRISEQRNGKIQPELQFPLNLS
jgi:hypothetical protein